MNRQTTTFTMDYNTGLTQALSDGTNTYIYGLDRIAQTHVSTADYFLTDALGSVRQLTDPTGAITFARTYDPGVYPERSRRGVTTQTTGAAQTAYGYTGEFTANNLVYLRARQYAPGMGRFLTRDTWNGNANSPLSFNRWEYAYGNSVNYIDPSGLSPIDDYYAANYHIRLTDGWPRVAKSAIYSAVQDVGWRFSTIIGGTPALAFTSIFDGQISNGSFGTIKFSWNPSHCYGCRPIPCQNSGDYGEHDPVCKPVGGVTYSSHSVEFASLWLSQDNQGWSPLYNNSDERARNNVVHELGHAFDNRLSNIPSSMLFATNIRTLGVFKCLYQSDWPRRSDTMYGPYYGFASRYNNMTWQMHFDSSSTISAAHEEFADMFLGWVYNKWETDDLGITDAGSTRANWMNKWMPAWLNTVSIHAG